MAGKSRKFFQQATAAALRELKQLKNRRAQIDEELVSLVHNNPELQAIYDEMFPSNPAPTTSIDS